MESSDVQPQRPGRLAFLTLASLGVVFGDIGTSPLYALRECFAGTHAIPVTPENVLGVLSLIFWSLVITVSLKYLIFVMRADNGGEGGILALVALVRPHPELPGTAALIAIGLFGAALLYGDGMITPAISVLSAVEGVNVATRAFERFVVPATVAILIALFMVQRRGTSGIGKIFGPIMIAWFVTIACVGVLAIREHTSVVESLDPVYAIRFFAAHGWRSFLTLGSVFLALTGAEALYADLGHFGRTPIRMAWFGLVMPALVLNYLGQGAVLLARPAVRTNPFYALVPGWGLYPLVVLATMATVIASQAIISGAFSLTMQAMQLGYSPRFDIHHTSSREHGQIYIPEVNWLLMIATVGLVLAFKSSTNLAAAYGMAVTTTMVITTVLAYAVARRLWKWSAGRALLVTGAFLIVDLAFFGANLIKIAHGGWFPLLVAAIVYTVMTTWHTGRDLVTSTLARAGRPLDAFLSELESHPPVRVPGTAIFMTARDVDVPPILVHHLKHNKVLHERVLLLTVATANTPTVDADHMVEFHSVGHGVYRVVTHYGFMQSPDVPAALERARARGLTLDDDMTYYLAHLTLFANDRIGMAAWRDKLFIVLARNARRATNFFHIPPDCVVEIGIQLEL